ncbi:type II secretion system secretin GspD [Frateuria aurantia]
MEAAFRLPLCLVLVVMAGCSQLQRPDDASLQREAMAGSERPAPPPQVPEQTAHADEARRPELSTGTGQYLRVQGRSGAKREAAGPGAVTFNFESQPVEAVVKAILGDLLKRNYTLAPGVQGQVSFSTSQPVDQSEALPILETLLGWTGNTLVLQDGRYVVTPLASAVAGNVVPSLGAAAPTAGLQARLFPLRYVSASEMQKLVRPFARADAVLLADPGRNLLVMAGTPQELRNYQQTIATFDVDWLRGTSVGVFSLEQANVLQLMEPLDSLFGPKGDTPLAGMFRFIPIERTNALVVITTQPGYLQEVGDWIEKMDRGGGNEQQLHVYDVHNIQAVDLAAYLSDIYGSGSDRSAARQSGSVAPGMTAATLGQLGNASGLGSTAGGFGTTAVGMGSRSGSSLTAAGRDPGGAGRVPGASRGMDEAGTGGTTLDNGVRIAAADGGNQLLVRARPSQWQEIEKAIRRLDTSPLQVQIEARILEVTLVNEFNFGVQWYLEGLAGATTSGSGSATTLVPGDARNHQQGAVGGGGNGLGSDDAFYYSFLTHNLQVAVHAMEASGKTKVLSAPSVVVMNNQVANFQVGDQVPVNTTSLNINSNADNVVNNASYISTGVLLSVQPRVNPGGLVYMTISQQVSSVLANSSNAQGNPTIAQRSIDTQVAVQSGQTVLLGGMIQQQDTDRRQGMPWLSRIPVLGYLFGTSARERTRTEIIVLLTPKVISSSAEAKDVSDEYQQKFQSLQPLQRPVSGH